MAAHPARPGNCEGRRHHGTSRSNTVTTSVRRGETRNKSAALRDTLPAPLRSSHSLRRMGLPRPRRRRHPSGLRRRAKLWRCAWPPPDTVCRYPGVAARERAITVPRIARGGRRCSQVGFSGSGLGVPDLPSPQGRRLRSKNLRSENEIRCISATLRNYKFKRICYPDAQIMSIKRECIKTGFAVTVRQYGEFLGHEFFLTRSELLEQFDYYRESRFSSLEVVGIRHRGSYLSPGAVAVVLDQETWPPTPRQDKVAATRTEPSRFPRLPESSVTGTPQAITIAEDWRSEGTTRATTARWFAPGSPLTGR